MLPLSRLSDHAPPSSPRRRRAPDTYLVSRRGRPPSGRGAKARASRTSLIDPPRLGGTIDQRYRLLKHLGSGGSADVYEAEHLRTGARCAIKVMHRHTAQDPEARRRFEAEARVTTTLAGEHVVHAFDAGSAPELGDTPFLVMEALCGQTLEDAAHQPLAPADALVLLGQLARALERIHELGFAHCDLKPDNLFVARSERGEPVLKLLDFGIAKSLREPVDGLEPRNGMVYGTPTYMAPEQARGNHDDIDARTDVWAFGLITFRLLCGRPYFDNDSAHGLLLRIMSEPMSAPSELGCDLSPAFDHWFFRTCSRDRHLRFDSAQRALEALRVALGDRADDVCVAMDTCWPAEAIATTASRALTVIGELPRANQLAVRAKPARRSSRFFVRAASLLRGALNVLFLAAVASSCECPRAYGGKATTDRLHFRGAHDALDQYPGIAANGAVAITQ